MKIMHRAVSALVVFAVIIILLITSIEIAAYSDWNYYQREYTRLGVLNNIPMEMNDLMDVTKEMMSYLRGDRADLVVETTIDGRNAEFFNEQEKFHMSEVRGLFLAGIGLRRLMIVIALAGTAVLFFTKATLSDLLPAAFQRGSILLAVLIGLAACFLSTDFNRYFTLFHEIFFDNDLWLFDPATSLMINMLPEPFWIHICARIGIIFSGLIVLCFTGCSVWRRLRRDMLSLEKTAAALVLVVILAVGPAGNAYAITAGAPLPGTFTNTQTEQTKAETAEAGDSQENAAQASEGEAAAEETATAAAENTGEAATANISHLLNATAPSDTANFSVRDMTGTDGWPAPPEIDSEGAILMDAKTGTILYGKNINEAYYPASITKIMTALLTLENCKLEDIVTFSYRATHELEQGSTHIARTEDEQLTVEDCLYALLLASANEVAQALSEHIAGSFEDFATLMNRRAEELGCTNTHFTNSSGLNSESHYTTCHDMALIMRACIQNPDFLRIEEASSYTIPATNKNPDPLPIAQKHKLVHDGGNHYEGALAGKTGYTTIAGNTLVTYAARGDMELICVVMHSIGTHYDDTRKLFDYGFDNFSLYQLVNQDLSALTNASGEPLSLPNGSQILPNEWITLPRDVDFSHLIPSLELIGGKPDADGNREAGVIRYSLNGTEYGEAVLFVLGGDAETTEETQTAEETTAVQETTSAENNSGPLSAIRKQLQKLPSPGELIQKLPSPKELGLTKVWDFLKSNWFLFLLGIAAIILLILLGIRISRNREKRRQKRNYRYGGHTTTRRTRRRGNKYTMKKK